MRPTEFELEAALRKARQGKTQQRQQRTVHSILEQLQALAYRQAALEGRGGAGDGFGLASRGSVAQVPQALPSGDTLEGGGIAAARLLSLPAVLESISRLQAWLIGLVASGACDLGDLVAQLYELAESSPKRAQELLHPFVLEIQAGVFARLEERGEGQLATAVQRVTQPQIAQVLDAVEVYGPDAAHGAELASRATSAATDSLVALSRFLLPTLVKALATRLEKAAAAEARVREQGIGSEGAAATAVAAWAAQIALLRAASRWSFGLMDETQREATATYIDAVVRLVLPRAQRSAQCRSLIECILPALATARANLDAAGDAAVEDLLLATDEPLEAVWNAEAPLRATAREWLRKRKLFMDASALLALLSAHAPAHELGSRWRTALIKGLVKVVRTSDAAGRARALITATEYVRSMPRCLLEHRLTLRDSWEADIEALLSEGLLRPLPAFPTPLPTFDGAPPPRTRVERAAHERAARRAQREALCALAAEFARHEMDVPIAVGVLRQALASGAAGKTSNEAHCNAMDALAAMLGSLKQREMMAGDGRARAASAPSAVALMAASDSGLSEYVVQALKEGDRGFVEPPRGLLACVCGGRSAEEMRQRRLKVACAALGALPLPLLSSARPGDAHAALDAAGQLALAPELPVAIDALDALLRALPLLSSELLHEAIDWLLRIAGERCQVAGLTFERAIRTLDAAVGELVQRERDAQLAGGWAESAPSSRSGSFVVHGRAGETTLPQARAELRRTMRIRVEGAAILSLVRPELSLQLLGASLVRRISAPELAVKEGEARQLDGAQPLAPDLLQEGGYAGDATAEHGDEDSTKVGWARQLERLLAGGHSVERHRWALEWAWSKLSALRLWEQRPASDDAVVAVLAAPPWSVWLNQWRFVCLAARQLPPEALFMSGGVAPWYQSLMSSSAVSECLGGAWKRLCMPEDTLKGASAASTVGGPLLVSEAAVGVALRTSLEQLHPSCHGLLLQCMRMHAEDARAAARGRRGRAGYSGEVRGDHSSVLRGPRSYAFEPEVVAMLAHVFDRMEAAKMTPGEAADGTAGHLNGVRKASKSVGGGKAADTTALQAALARAVTLGPGPGSPIHSSVEVSLQEVVYAWLQAKPSPVESRGPAFRCNMLAVATQYLAHAKQLGFNVPRSQMLVAITSTWLHGNGGLAGGVAVATGEGQVLSTAEAIALRRAALRALCALLALGPSQSEQMGTAAAQFTKSQLESPEGSELYDEASACLALLLENEPYRLGYFLLATFGDMRAAAIEGDKSDAESTVGRLGSTRHLRRANSDGRGAEKRDAAATMLASAHLRAIVWCAESGSDGWEHPDGAGAPDVVSHGWLRARRLADGEGIYVCLLHLCSPAAERRQLALRMLRALLRSMSPNDLLPLPLPPFDQAPPEAHIQASAATSAVLAAARPGCSGLVLREAVALHTSLPLTLLPSMLTVLKPWAACFPRLVSDAPAEDSAAAARAALLSLFDMVRLCGWPSREAPLLRPLWAVLMPEPSSPAALKDACANFIARFLTEAHAAGGGAVLEPNPSGDSQVSRSAFTSLPRVNLDVTARRTPGSSFASSVGGAWWLQAPIIMLDEPLHLGGWWVRGERRNALTERRLAKLALSYALAAPAATPLIGALVAQLRPFAAPEPVLDASAGWSLAPDEVAWEASGGFEPLVVSRRERSTIALLAEAAYEHGELLLPHLARLLHASLAVRGIGDKGDEAPSAKRAGDSLLESVWSTDAPGRTLVSFGIHSLAARLAPTEGRRARAEALLSALLPSPATGSSLPSSLAPSSGLVSAGSGAMSVSGELPRPLSPSQSASSLGTAELHRRGRSRDGSSSARRSVEDELRMATPEPFVLIRPVADIVVNAPTTELSLNPMFVCALFDAFAPAYPTLARDWAHESLGWAFRCADERAVLASLRVLAAAEMRQPLSEAALRGVLRLLLAALRTGCAGAARGCLEVFEAAVPHLWAAADRLDDVSVLDAPRTDGPRHMREPSDVDGVSRPHYSLSMSEWMRTFDLLISAAVAALCLRHTSLHDQALSLAASLILGGGRRAGSLRRRRALRPRALASRMRGAWRRAAAEMDVTMDAAVTAPLFRSLLNPVTATRGLTMLEIFGEVYADTLPAGNRLVILVLLFEAALATTDDDVEGGSRSRRARHVARFVSRCGFALPEVHAAFEHLEIGSGVRGALGTGASGAAKSWDGGFLQDFFSGFSLSFPEEDSWRFALRSVVAAAAHGVPRWRVAFMRLLRALLSARAHAWTRGDFAAVADLLGSQGGGSAVVGGSAAVNGNGVSSAGGGSGSRARAELLEDLRVQLLEHAPFDVTARVFDALGGQTTSKSSNTAKSSAPSHVAADPSLRQMAAESSAERRVEGAGAAHEAPALCESWFEGLRSGVGASGSHSARVSMDGIAGSYGVSRANSFTTSVGSTVAPSTQALSDDGLSDEDDRYFPFDSDIEDGFDQEDEDAPSSSGGNADISGAGTEDDRASQADSADLMPLSARSSISADRGSLQGIIDGIVYPPPPGRSPPGGGSASPTHRRSGSSSSIGIRSAGGRPAMPPLILLPPSRAPKGKRPSHRRSASAGPEVFSPTAARRPPAVRKLVSGGFGSSAGGAPPMHPRTAVPKRSPPPSPLLAASPEQPQPLSAPQVSTDGLALDVDGWVPVVEGVRVTSPTFSSAEAISSRRPGTAEAFTTGAASAIVSSGDGDADLASFTFA